MKYTHVDKDGMRWRFEGARPVSELADRVMRVAKAKLELQIARKKNKEIAKRWARLRRRK